MPKRLFCPPPRLPLPDSVGFEQAAAVLLKGMTVDYLFNDTFPLKGGETVLFHAAAGGRAHRLPMGAPCWGQSYRHGLDGSKMRAGRKPWGEEMCFVRRSGSGRKR